jgi:dTDP-4-dehydrorhamnose 3,5-epimerase
MKAEKTFIEGLIVFEPDVFEDPRGYFLESFNEKRYKEYGLDYRFVQDNISKSYYGTIRGLHYQVEPYAQGKLCFVIKGKSLDVAVDIRHNSPTFGKHFAIELTEQNKKQLWIPPGFAHGFAALSDEVIFYYKCANFYDKASERSIYYADEELDIDWKIDSPIVSEKDLKAKSFKDIEKDF